MILDEIIFCVSLQLFSFAFAFLSRAQSQSVCWDIFRESYSWGLCLAMTIILDCYWGHLATKPDFRDIVLILQWFRRLGTMGKFWMSNPMPEQYKVIIPLFSKVWWQSNSILVIRYGGLSFQFDAHGSIWLPQLVLHHRLNFYLFHL